MANPNLALRPILRPQDFPWLLHTLRLLALALALIHIYSGIDYSMLYSIFELQSQHKVLYPYNITFSKATTSFTSQLIDDDMTDRPPHITGIIQLIPAPTPTYTPTVTATRLPPRHNARSRARETISTKVERSWLQGTYL